MQKNNTSDLRIVEVASGDFFSTYGGGQAYVKNIVDELSRQHKNISIISFVDSPYGIEEKSYNGIPLYEVGNDISRLKSLVTEIRPDIIHAHSHKASIIKIGKALGIPVVVTAHHGGILCPTGALINYHDHICDVPVSHRNCLKCVLRNIKFGKIWYPLMRFLPKKQYIQLGKLIKKLPFILFVTPVGEAALQIEKKYKDWNTITNGCSLIIAPCYRIKDAMERNGMDSSKIKILPHGIPQPSRIPKFPNIVNGEIEFFYTGRICYVKGIHILLEAFHALNAPNAKLHLIGGTGNKEEEKYCNRLKNKFAKDNRIIWHGKIPQEKIYETISNFHVCVSSSICLEIFGLNITEALAMGKPVLATMTGGAEMQITDGVNGWLVAPNKDAIQRKMDYIVKHLTHYDSTLSVSSVMSISEHCQNLMDIYKQVDHEIKYNNSGI